MASVPTSLGKWIHSPWFDQGLLVRKGTAPACVWCLRRAMLLRGFVFLAWLCTGSPKYQAVPFKFAGQSLDVIHAVLRRYTGTHRLGGVPHRRPAERLGPQKKPGCCPSIRDGLHVSRVFAEFELPCSRPLLPILCSCDAFVH